MGFTRRRSLPGPGRGDDLERLRSHSEAGLGDSRRGWTAGGQGVLEAAHEVREEQESHLHGKSLPKALPLACNK